MKLILLLITVFLCSVASADTPKQTLPDTVVISQEDIKIIEHTLNSLAQERNDAKAHEEYWYGKYKSLKTCILEHSETAAASCLPTI